MEAGVRIFQKERLPRERAMAQGRGRARGRRLGENEYSLLNSQRPGQGHHLQLQEPTCASFHSLAIPQKK